MSPMLAHVGPMLANLALSCPYVGPMFAYMHPILPYVDPMLASVASILPLCSPMLALEMLSPIAVTETAEVGTGWERGGEEVGRGLPRPGRRLGRHASITFGCHRRPPARTRAGLRGPAPGFSPYKYHGSTRTLGVHPSLSLDKSQQKGL